MMSVDIFPLTFIYDHRQEAELGLQALILQFGFPGGSDSKESACGAGDQGSIPGSGSCAGEGNGDPLQYSCLENPMGGGVWQATDHGVTKSQTRLSYRTELRGVGWGRSRGEVQEGGDICVLATDFLCCMGEANTTL